MNTRNHHSQMDIIILSFTRLGFCGRVPKAPGTVGSLAAAAIAPALFLPLPLHYRALVLVAIFFVGSWAITRAEKVLGEKDPSSIVIDELVGQWIAYLPLPVGHFQDQNIWHLAIGFALFRLFDISKPWLIKKAEHWLPGGYGVMIDDVLAGLAAAGVLLAIKMWWF